MRTIDLNCDLGEIPVSEGGLRLTSMVIPYISSANIACGYHAGGEEEIRTTIAAIKVMNESGEGCCQIGAHPGFLDRENFGRTEVLMTPEDIRNLVIEQLKIMTYFCNEAGVKMSHVKPHGALYNMAAADFTIANAICMAIAYFDPSLMLVGPAGSALEDAAVYNHMPFASEVFADRTYDPSGRLTPRSEEGAVITDVEIIKARALMASQGTIIASDGSFISTHVDTICLHGDNDSAVAAAKEIKEAFDEAGIVVRPMSSLVRGGSAPTTPVTFDVIV